MLNDFWMVLGLCCSYIFDLHILQQVVIVITVFNYVLNIFLANFIVLVLAERTWGHYWVNRIAVQGFRVSAFWCIRVVFYIYYFFYWFLKTLFIIVYFRLTLIQAIIKLINHIQDIFLLFKLLANKLNHLLLDNVLLSVLRIRLELLLLI